MEGSWVRSNPAGSGTVLFDKEKVSELWLSCGSCSAFCTSAPFVVYLESFA